MSCFLRKSVFTFILIFVAFWSFSGPAFASGGEKMRLAVMDFKDNSQDGAPARAIQDMMTGELAKVPLFSVIERAQLGDIAQEQRMSAQGLTDESASVEMSRIKAAQYLIAGSITQYHYLASGGAVPIPVPIFGAVAVASEEAHVTIDLRVIDTTTSEVIMTSRQTGVANQSQGGVVTAYGGFGTGKAGGLLSQATYKSVTKLVSDLQDKLLGDRGAFGVLDSSTQDVTCNMGHANSGVKKGELYAAYRKGNVIRDLDGKELGASKNYLCVFKITDVDAGYSSGKIVKGCVPRRGALVMRAPSNWKELKFEAEDYASAAGGFDIDEAMKQKQAD